MNIKKTLTLLHGTKNFEGKEIEIKESKKGRYESGVGFYMTTSYNTARKYARSSQHVLTITLEELNFLNKEHKCTADAMLDFIDSQYRMKGKSKVMRDLYDCIESDNTINIKIFMNLLIMNECLAGRTGVNFANWLVEKGIDAVVENHDNQDWVVLFNPKKVIDINKNAHNYNDTERVKDQIKNYQIFHEKQVLLDNTVIVKNHSFLGPIRP